MRSSGINQSLPYMTICHLGSDDVWFYFVAVASLLWWRQRGRIIVHELTPHTVEVEGILNRHAHGAAMTDIGNKDVYDSGFVIITGLHGPCTSSGPYSPTIPHSPALSCPPLSCIDTEVSWEIADVVVAMAEA